MRNSFLAGYLLLISFIYLYAGQPVDIIKKNPSAYFVKQGAGQCGPASFYMIFRFYGDDIKNLIFSKGADGRLFSMDIETIKSGSKNAKSSQLVIRKNSPVAEWMNGKDGSTGWGELTSAVKNLYFVNASGRRDLYYDMISSCDKMTNPGKKDQFERSRNFYEIVTPRFLDKNRPVIVHLKRSWPFPGHYLVLIGYDHSTSTVFYMDPNDKSGAAVREVSAGDFLGTYWYEGDRDLHWGNAGWSGRWIGFYRSDFKNK